MPTKITDPAEVQALNIGQLTEQVRLRNGGTLVLGAILPPPDGDQDFRVDINVVGPTSVVRISASNSNQRLALVEAVLVHDQVEAILNSA